MSAGSAFSHILRDDKLALLAQRLGAHYETAEPPKIARWELVPSVYPRHHPHGVVIGQPPPRNAASPDHVKHTLLYSHRIVTRDPFYGLTGPAKGRGMDLAVRGALNFWIALEELVESGVVLVTRPAHSPQTPDIRDLMERLSQDREFRNDLLALFPDTADYAGRARGPGSLAALLKDPTSWPRTRRSPRSADLVGPTGESSSRNAVRAQALLDAVDYQEFCGTGNLNSALINIDQWFESIGVEGLDAWFPDRQHIELLLLLMRHGLTSPLTDVASSTAVARLVELNMPSVSQLATADIVRLRRNSGVLETWRTDLSNALERMEDMARAGLDDLAERAALRDHMQAVAEHAQAEIRSSKRARHFDSLRSMTFGVVGASIGGSLDGLRGAAIGAIGAAADASFQMIESRIDHAKTKAAQGARLTHALALAED